MHFGVLHLLIYGAVGSVPVGEPGQETREKHQDASTVVPEVQMPVQDGRGALGGDGVEDDQPAPGGGARDGGGDEV